MKYSLDIEKKVVIDYLRDFEAADAVYIAVQRELFDFDFDHGTSDELKAIRKKLQMACADREYYAVAVCSCLKHYSDILAPADAPEDAPADAPADAPEDAPEDSSVDVSENVPENFPAADPVDTPEDIFPAMSAKCKLCPSCVDGRCFFVPDIYDSEFPCPSSAWDNFFKSGGSHGPAP